MQSHSVSLLFGADMLNSFKSALALRRFTKRLFNYLCIIIIISTFHVLLLAKVQGLRDMDGL